MPDDGADRTVGRRRQPLAQRRDEPLERSRAIPGVYETALDTLLDDRSHAARAPAAPGGGRPRDAVRRARAGRRGRARLLEALPALAERRPVQPRPVRDPARRDLGRARLDAAGGPRVELVATAPDGTTVAGRDGRFSGLEPGVALPLDGVGGRRRPGRRVVPHRAARPPGADHASPRSATTARAPTTSGRSGARWRRSSPTSSSPPATTATWSARRCCSTATSSGRSTT